eukprot:m.108736 g.108736  ORF g.108736 m.108736 type:complete len:158 (-) comp9194_c0_seq6:1860-2333(-)
MVQGKSKRKAKAIVSASRNKNTIHHQRRDSKRTKKGARVISARRNKVIAHMKTHVQLEKTIKNNIEAELTNRAQEGPLKILKPGASFVPTGKLMKQIAKETDKTEFLRRVKEGEKKDAMMEKQIEQHLKEQNDLGVGSDSDSDDDSDMEDVTVKDTL